MRDEKPKNNQGFPGRVEKVKGNHIIDMEKEVIQEFLYHSLLRNSTVDFNHFRHPTRKRPVKRGQSGWFNVPPGSPRSSPGMGNGPLYTVARLTTPGQHTIFFFPAVSGRGKYRSVNIYLAVEEGGQNNE